MSQSLEEIQQRLSSIRGLGEIVGAMRALAAMRNQEAQNRIGGARAYAAVLRGAVTRALDLLPPSDSATDARAHRAHLLIAFGAEYGFAGGFTRHIVETIAKTPHDLLWIVGRRGLLLCQEEKRAVDRSFAMATQAGALFDAVQRIATELHLSYGAGTLGRLDLVFARREGLGFALEPRSLLPLALPPTPSHSAYPPLLNEPPEALIAALVEEYIFAELLHAAAESFFSENTARLMTMDTARHNIDDKLESLVADERRLRQEETTTELFDVMTGVAAAAARRAIR